MRNLSKKKTKVTKVNYLFVFHLSKISFTNNNSFYLETCDDTVWQLCFTECFTEEVSKSLSEDRKHDIIVLKQVLEHFGATHRRSNT